MSTMSATILAAPLFVILETTQVPAESPVLDAPAVAQFADALVPRKLEEHHIPGAVFVVVRGTEILYQQGYGLADVESGRAVDSGQTVFRVASVSKLLTATAVMQMVERGLINLDSDIDSYLDNWSVRGRFDGPVTMRHLLTHTGGFEERNIGRRTYDEGDLEALGVYLARSMPPRIMPSGQVITYSNYGMALAGHVLERVSGQPFETHIQENLLEPLAMRSSGFANPGRFAGRLATGYEYSNGVLESVRFEFLRTTPASMLMTTGDDMARFMIVHLNKGVCDGVRVLSPESVTAMHDVQFTHHPQLAGIGFGFFRARVHDLVCLLHTGHFAGFHSRVYLFPEKGVGVFLAFNNNSGNAAAPEIVGEFLNHFYPGPDAPSARDAIEGHRERAWRFKGRYLDTGSPMTTIESLERFPGRGIRVAPTDDGRINLNWSGGYREVEPLLFQNPEDGDYISFAQNEAGEITHLFLGWTAYRMQPWYERGEFHGPLALVLMCTFLASLLLDMRRRPRGSGRSAERLMWTISGLYILFVLALIIGLKTSDPRFGLTQAFRAIFILPIATCLLALYAPFVLWRAMRAEPWSRLKRMRLVWTSVAALAMIGVLHYWNLLGFNF